MFIDDFTGNKFETVEQAEAWKREECKKDIISHLSEYDVFSTDDFLDWIFEKNLIDDFVKDHQEEVDNIIETEVRIWSTYDLGDDSIEEEEDA